MNISEIAEAAKPYILDIVRDLLPNGRVGNGKRDYRCGSLEGEAGNSLSIDLETGSYYDHNTEESGGDIVALVAAVRGLRQSEAAKEVQEIIGQGEPQTEIAAEKKPVYNITMPPDDAPPLRKYIGDHQYEFRNQDGDLVFYQVRWDEREGKRKGFSPYSWDATSRQWVSKKWPKIKPLFGEHLIEKGKPIMLVEGCKTALAAQKLVGTRYCVVTWDGGKHNLKDNNWAVVRGHEVLVWPDADVDWRVTARKLVDAIKKYASHIKILDPSIFGSDGEDAADINMDWSEFVVVAKQQVIMDEEWQTEQRPIQRKSHQPTWEELGLVIGSGGMPANNLDNAMRVFERHEKFRDRIWFDSFHGKLYTTIHGEKTEWNDEDDRFAQLYMQRDLKMANISDRNVSSAVQLIGRKCSRYEPRDWMESLEWDGTERLNTWLHSCLGASKSEYNAEIGMRWFVSMVARIYNPGCKVDTMLILEGAQGTGKSQAMAIVGGDWYREINAEIGSQAWREQIQGVMLAELAELNSLSRADERRIKTELSTTNDRFRPSYGRRAVDHPRRLVLVGTTNEKHYFRDVTGARRYWPVRTRSINLSELQNIRTQLFAEAVEKYRKGERHWLDNKIEEAAREEQEQRREADPWEERISEWLRLGEYEAIRIRDILDNCLQLETSRQGVLESRRVGNCLRAIGWDLKGKGTSSYRGQVARWFYKPDYPSVLV